MILKYFIYNSLPPSLINHTQSPISEAIFIALFSKKSEAVYIVQAKWVKLNHDDPPCHVASTSRVKTISNQIKLVPYSPLDLTYNSIFLTPVEFVTDLHKHNQ